MWSVIGYESAGCGDGCGGRYCVFLWQEIIVCRRGSGKQSGLRIVKRKGIRVVGTWAPASQS